MHSADFPFDLLDICSFVFLAHLTRCQKERRTALGPLGSAPPGRFAPECNSKGQYISVQCYTATGYCWCVDSLGREVPGTRKKGRVSCPDKGCCFHFVFIARASLNLGFLVKEKKAFIKGPSSALLYIILG